MRTIFLSYCSADTVIANIIEESLNRALRDEIYISRYTRDVKYKDSFKSFMNTISEHDFVLSIVSDAYLKSFACLYEVGEIVKDHNFKERILFVVLSDEEKIYYTKPIPSIAAKIYDDESQIEYVTYWENEYEKAKDNLKRIKSEIARISSLEKIKGIRKIIDYDLRTFMDYLSDANGKRFNELAQNNFFDLVNLIKPTINQFENMHSFEDLFETAIRKFSTITMTDYNQIILSSAIETHALGLVVFADAIAEYKQHYRVVVLSGLISNAYQSGETYNIADVNNEDNYFNAVFETKSELIIPIKYKGMVVGLFNSESENTNYYQSDIVNKASELVNDFSYQLHVLDIRKIYQCINCHMFHLR